MANTYSWDCKTVDAWVELDDNSDVVYNIHYICTITSDKKDKDDNYYTQSTIGTTGISTDDIKDFIAFKDLTNAKVTEWCQDSLGEVQVQNIKDSLKSRLDDLITPKSVTLTLDS
tara:strand:- start:415 stop:759 length:345 start_codon:yes stop_codon:yes gene_type:complete